MKMLNKWDYNPEGEICYGEEVVYKKAADFLGDSVEDWGCGTCWAKKYFKDYKGIDGSTSCCVTKVQDLRDYTSNVNNILLRQVLEHNYDWQKILENAKKSFKKKLCITVHTPFSDSTHVLGIEESNQIPDISFKLEDILDYFKDYKVTKETIPTKFRYKEETLIYVEKV